MTDLLLFVALFGVFVLLLSPVAATSGGNSYRVSPTYEVLPPRADLERPLRLDIPSAALYMAQAERRNGNDLPTCLIRSLDALQNLDDRAAEIVADLERHELAEILDCDRVDVLIRSYRDLGYEREAFAYRAGRLAEVYFASKEGS